MNHTSMHAIHSAGTTTYGFSPASKKVNAHIDTWDLTDQQDWFSADGAAVIAGKAVEVC
jgi:hypothetical protein